MVDFLRSWLLTIVYIAIFLLMVDIIIPSGKIRKVVGMAAGFIMIISIVKPVVGLFGKNINIDKAFIASSNFLDISEIEANSKSMEQAQVNQVIELYRQKLLDRINSTLSNLEGGKPFRSDIIINEDLESEDFGQVERIYFWLDRESANTSSGIKIDRILIDSKEPAEQKEIEGSDNENAEEIRKKVAALLNINEEQVVISIGRN